MFVSKQFRLTSKLWCVPLWSSYVKRWAMTAPSMWQISSCVSFVSCKILCNAWFQTQATNEFYRNVINNNKITPNKQASIIGSKEWHDEKWSSVLRSLGSFMPIDKKLSNRFWEIASNWKMSQIWPFLPLKMNFMTIQPNPSFYSRLLEVLPS